jgi:hypothetical protein
MFTIIHSQARGGHTMVSNDDSSGTLWIFFLFFFPTKGVGSSLPLFTRDCFFGGSVCFFVQRCLIHTIYDTLFALATFSLHLYMILLTSSLSALRFSQRGGKAKTKKL